MSAEHIRLLYRNIFCDEWREFYQYESNILTNKTGVCLEADTCALWLLSDLLRYLVDIFMLQRLAGRKDAMLLPKGTSAGWMTISRLQRRPVFPLKMLW